MRGNHKTDKNHHSSGTLAIESPSQDSVAGAKKTKKEPNQQQHNQRQLIHATWSYGFIWLDGNGQTLYNTSILEFGRSLVVFADAPNKANWRTVSAGFTIYGERLAQINPDRAEPEVLGMQKHEFRFFCTRKLFCWFNAGHYPFTKDLD